MFGILISAIDYNVGNAIQWVLMSLMLLASVALIVVVMMQKSSGDDSVSAITGGGSDSFYGKNKSKTVESKLRKLTVVCIVLMTVLMIAFYVIERLLYVGA